MLLLGFGAALRHSEMMAMQFADLEQVPGRGLRLLVRCSKTDQRGQGQHIVVLANPAETLLCPVIVLNAWLTQLARAHDVEWSASEAMRQERPLFCAVT